MCGFLSVASTATEPVTITRAARHIAWRGKLYGRYKAPDITVFAARLPRFGDRSRPQPAVSAKGDILCLNGSLYNVRELVTRLGLAVSDDASDTEALLTCLCKTNLGLSSLLSELRGEYALLHYDAASRAITLSRDGFGSRPLFYSAQSNRLIVSSSPRAVRELAFPNGGLKPTAVAEYLRYGVSEDPSAYEGVASIKAGTCVEFRSPFHNQIVHQIEPFRCKETSVAGALAAAVHERVMDARCWLAFSAGVDSASILRCAGQPFSKLFYIGMSKNSAEKTPEYYGADLLTPSPAELFRALRQFGGVIGRPLTTLSGVAMYLLAQRGVSEGLENQISGEGADELFGGYMHTDSALSGHPTLYNASAASMPAEYAFGISLPLLPTRLVPQLASVASIPERRWFDRKIRLPEHLCQINSDIPTMLAGAESRLPFIDLQKFDETFTNPHTLGKKELAAISGVSTEKIGFGISCQNLGFTLLQALLEESVEVPNLLGAKNPMDRFVSSWLSAVKIGGELGEYLTESLSRMIVGFWSTAQLSHDGKIENVDFVDVDLIESF